MVKIPRKRIDMTKKAASKKEETPAPVPKKKKKVPAPTTPPPAPVKKRNNSLRSTRARDRDRTDDQVVKQSKRVDMKAIDPMGRDFNNMVSDNDNIDLYYTPGSSSEKAIELSRQTKNLVKQPAAIKRTKDNDTYTIALQQTMNGTCGDNMALGRSPQSASHRVMPMPLILQIPTQINGLPFSSVVEVAGDKGSNKSSFVMGLANIINGQSYFAPNYRGWCDYFSAETKFPDQLVWSITGYLDELEIIRPGLPQPVVAFHSETMDDWQTVAQSRIKQYNKLVSPERQLPLLMAVDSLSGKFLQETYDKIEREGVAGRAFAVEAYSFKKWISKVAGDIAMHPIIMLLVNHVARDKEPGKFQETRRKPGGRFLSYQEVLDFDLKRIGNTQEEDLPDSSVYHKRNYNVIRCTVEKNSMGDTGVSVDLIFSWSRTPPHKSIKDRTPRQRSSWLWGEALAGFLSDKTKRATNLRRRIDDIAKVRYVAPHIYKCAQLGNKEMRGEALGRMIEMNPEMHKALSDLFGITQYPVFEPLTNYGELRRMDIAAKAKEEFEGAEDEDEE